MKLSTLNVRMTTNTPNDPPSDPPPKPPIQDGEDTRGSGTQQ